MNRHGILGNGIQQMLFCLILYQQYHLCPFIGYINHVALLVFDANIHAGLTVALIKTI